MNLEKIKELARQYDADNMKDPVEMTARFKKLVEKYGVSAVAAATGLAESSVSVYARSSKTVSVPEYTVQKAETVLSSI